MFVVKYKGYAPEAMRNAEVHGNEAAYQHMFQPTWCWVNRDEWGPGGINVQFSESVHGHLPLKIMTFKSEEDAHAFMKEFDGHPWYYTNSGEYQVVKVEPRMVQQGWKLVT